METESLLEKVERYILPELLWKLWFSVTGNITIKGIGEGDKM